MKTITNEINLSTEMTQETIFAETTTTIKNGKKKSKVYQSKKSTEEANVNINDDLWVKLLHRTETNNMPLYDLIILNKDRRKVGTVKLGIIQRYSHQKRRCVDTPIILNFNNFETKYTAE